MCVGCYEDSAVASLEYFGYRIKGVDPALNYDLSTYIKKYPQNRGTFDIIFSTSVIEHVEDDERFVREIYDLLSPGGVAILPVPHTSNNEYRNNELFHNILLFRN